jgi:hypothetical protein
VGKAALEGLDGIVKVTRGFADGREINTVYYKPSLISSDQIIDALKASGTYIGTAKEK